MFNMLAPCQEDLAELQYLIETEAEKVKKADEELRKDTTRQIAEACTNI